MRIKGSSLSLLAIFGLCVRAQHCPNFCSGHGTCDVDLTCDCEDGWEHFADCSGRTCPTGVAWTSRAHTDNVAHSEFECSNRGHCDRTTGICRCAPGHFGMACERLECPGVNGKCSNNGACVSMARAALEHGANGSAVGITYSNWDAELIQTCICGWGRTGPDCSIRMCPKGDDPITTGQGYRTINMTIYSTGGAAMSGSVAVRFDGQEFDINVDASESSCEIAWESLKNIEDVNCTKLADSDSATSYHIEFVKFPTFPSQNNIYEHDGNPSIYSFQCDTSDAETSTGDVSCSFADVVSSNVIEYSTCSGRGVCTDGVCKCFDGYSGAACDQTASDLPDLSLNDVLSVESDLSDFEANLLYLSADRSASTSFNLLYAERNGNAYFTLDGAGDVTIHEGGLTVTSGGATVTAGGLEVTGGTTVNSGGLYVIDGGATISSDGVVIESGGDLTMSDCQLSMTGTPDGISIITDSPTSSQVGISLQKSALGSTAYKFIEIVDDYDTTSSSIFTITAEPSTAIDQGGLTVVGGVTISSGGLTVSSGGATVSGALTVAGLESTSVITGTTAYFSGAVTASSHATITSDRRLKENIAPLAERSKSLLDLEGVSYHLRDRNNLSRAVKNNELAKESKLFGFIAQDVQEHFPELVSTSPEGWLGLKYSAFTPIIVEVLKWQHKEIETMKQRERKTMELERQILQLEKRLSAVEQHCKPENDPDPTSEA